MHIAGRDQRLAEPARQLVHLAVDVPEILIRLHGEAVVKFQKVIVVNGLDLEEVVELRHLLQLRIGTPGDDAADQLARLTGRADDDPLAVLLQDGTRHTRTAALLRPAEVADMRERDELIEVIEPRFIFRQKDDVKGAGVVLAVDEIALHAIDDLDVDALFRKGTCRIHRLGECLHDAVVGDGDRRPPPACRRLDEHLGRDDGIERAHLRMRVQLDALFLRRILALRDAAPLHAVDEEHIVADEFIVFDFPLDAHCTALADRLDDAFDLGVDLLLCRLAARGEKLLAADAVRRIGKFDGEDIGTGLQLVRLRVKDLTLEDDVLDLVLDHAQRACLARDAAPHNDIGRELLRLGILRRARRCGGWGRLGWCGGRHGGRCPVCAGECPAERRLLADDAAGAADMRAHGMLDTSCRTALRKELCAECTGRRDTDDVAVHSVVRLQQRMIEDGIARGSIADDLLPERRNGRGKRDEILLDEHLRELIVRRHLRRDALDESIIHDRLRSDDNLPRIAAYLDMADDAGTQKSPLLLGEGEPMQQAQQQICRTGKDSIGLHSSYSLLYCSLSSSTRRT